jgi:hypothetical protein
MIRSIGGFLFLLGVVYLALHFFGYELKIMKWSYLWGESAAWGIKIGMIVLGALLYVIGGKIKR